MAGSNNFRMFIEEALVFANRIHDPQVKFEFLDIIIEFGSSKTGTVEARQQIAVLFRGHQGNLLRVLSTIQVQLDLLSSYVNYMGWRKRVGPPRFWHNREIRCTMYCDLLGKS